MASSWRLIFNSALMLLAPISQFLNIFSENFSKRLGEIVPTSAFHAEVRVAMR